MSGDADVPLTRTGAKLSPILPRAMHQDVVHVQRSCFEGSLVRMTRPKPKIDHTHVKSGPSTVTLPYTGNQLKFVIDLTERAYANGVGSLEKTMRVLSRAVDRFCQMLCSLGRPEGLRLVGSSNLPENEDQT